MTFYNCDLECEINPIIFILFEFILILTPVLKISVSSTNSYTSLRSLGRVCILEPWVEVEFGRVFFIMVLTALSGIGFD